jgi:Flp pilus assembly protein CpaB
MTSPDLIRELKAARPVAPAALRARVREIAAEEMAPKRSFWPSLQFRRITAVAAPTVAALAIVIAGIVGLAKSDGVGGENAATPVLVANRLIPAGTPGTLVASQTMYAPTTLPRKEIEVGAIADPQYLSGRAAAIDIFPGQQFTATDFAADPNATVESQITGTQRAISISIDNVHGSLSQVAAGDSVDVYSGVPGDVKLFRPNVKVLAVPTAQGGNLVLGVETKDAADFAFAAADNAQLSFVVRPVLGAKPTARDTATAATGLSDNRAQRISATLTVEVENSNGVSTAAQEALDLTKSLGGYVVSSSVTTGEEGNATLTVRIPVAKVQQAIVQLSGLGRIVSQQVQTDDLQGSLDALERRERSVRAQIAIVTARLDSESLDAPTRALLEARLKTLRSELRQLRRDTAATSAEARMATIQMSIVTPDVLGAVPVPSRLDRSLDEALNVLVWEGVVALAIAIVAAPFALIIAATWIGRSLYRRREEERLLET